METWYYERFQSVPQIDFKEQAPVIIPKPAKKIVIIEEEPTRDYDSFYFYDDYLVDENSYKFAS